MSQIGPFLTDCHLQRLADTSLTKTEQAVHRAMAAPQSFHGRPFPSFAKAVHRCSTSRGKQHATDNTIPSVVCSLLHHQALLYTRLDTADSSRPVEVISEPLQLSCITLESKLLLSVGVGGRIHGHGAEGGRYHHGSSHSPFRSFPRGKPIMPGLFPKSRDHLGEQDALPAGAHRRQWRTDSRAPTARHRRKWTDIPGLGTGDDPHRPHCSRS